MRNALSLSVALCFLALPGLAAEQASEPAREVEQPVCVESSPSAPSPKDLDPAPHYKAGVEAMKKGEHQAALDAFNRCLELNPYDYRASFQKAVLFQITGHPEHALRRYEQIVERYPDMAEARINLGSLYRGRDNARAEEQFRKAIDLYFYSFPAHYNLGNLLLEQNRLEEALKEYKICLKLNAKNPHVHNNIGVIYQKKSYLEEAAEEYQKAVKLEPANQLFQDNLRQVRKLLAAKRSPKFNF